MLRLLKEVDEALGPYVPVAPTEQPLVAGDRTPAYISFPVARGPAYINIKAAADETPRTRCTTESSLSCVSMGESD